MQTLATAIKIIINTKENPFLHPIYQEYPVNRIMQSSFLRFPTFPKCTFWEQSPSPATDDSTAPESKHAAFPHIQRLCI